MSRRARELLDDLDAELFSGDAFEAPDALDALEEHLDRWKRKANELRDSQNEIGI